MSKEGNGQTQKIVIGYKESPDYRVVPANGAWGGLTPKGEIMMNLYFEHGNNPVTVTHDIRDGKLGPEVSRDMGEAAVIRQLQVGVVMTVATAESVAKWMLDKVEQLKAAQKGGS